MSSLPRLVSFALVVGFAPTVSAEDDPAPYEVVIEAEAERLTLDPDRNLIEAEGHIVLTSGPLQINAKSLVLDLNKGVVDMHAPLIRQYKGLRIGGRRMILGPNSQSFEIEAPKIALLQESGAPRAEVKGSRAFCSDGRCVLLDADGTACPHQPPGYHIGARQVTVHPNGDLDLRRPVLYFENIPVFAAPWLRIRAAGEPGFLPPRIGWDRRGGFILGPSGYVPIGTSSYAQGHIAVRTSQGVETFSLLKTTDASLSIDHLLDGDENDIRLRTVANPDLEGANLALDVDVATGREVVDDLAKEPLDRAVTHLSSRALLSTIFGGAVVESYAEMIQPFGYDEPSNRFMTPRTSVAIEVPSVPWAVFLWPSVDLRFTRIEALGIDAARDAAESVAPSHMRLEASPEIDVPLSLGPFAVDARIASRHQVWMPDGADKKTISVNLLATEADLSIPLARDFVSFWHTVTPYVRYRAVPWFAGSSPKWVVDDFDRLEKGHGMETGVRTDIQSRGASRIAGLAVAERIGLEGLGKSAGPIYMVGSLEIGPPQARLVVDGAFDHELKKTSTAGVAVSSQIEEHGSFEMEGRWIGPGKGPQVDYLWNSSSGPWIVRTWPSRPGEAMELTERLSLRITKQVEGKAGARVGVWPSQSLNALWYGVELTPKCRCIAAGLFASHRPSALIPDVMATLKLMQI